jgi:hypothetical protein
MSTRQCKATPCARAMRIVVARRNFNDLTLLAEGETGC